MADEESGKNNEQFVGEPGIKTFRPGVFDVLRIVGFAIIACVIVCSITSWIDMYIRISLIYALLIGYGTALGARIAKGSKRITIPLMLLIMFVALLGLIRFYHTRFIRAQRSFAIEYAEMYNTQLRKLLSESNEDEEEEGETSYPILITSEDIEAKNFISVDNTDVKEIADRYLEEMTGSGGFLGYIKYLAKEGCKLEVFDYPIFRISSFYVPLWWTLEIVLMLFLNYQTLRPRTGYGSVYT